MIDDLSFENLIVLAIIIFVISVLLIVCITRIVLYINIRKGNIKDDDFFDVYMKTSTIVGVYLAILYSLSTMIVCNFIYDRFSTYPLFGMYLFVQGIVAIIVVRVFASIKAKK